MKRIERVLLILVFVGPIGFYIVQRAGLLEPVSSAPIARDRASRELAGEPRLPSHRGGPSVQRVPEVTRADAIPVVSLRPDKAGMGHRQISETPSAGDYLVALVERERAAPAVQDNGSVGGNEKPEPSPSAIPPTKEQGQEAVKPILSSEEEARKAKSKKQEAKNERARIRQLFAVRSEEAAMKMQQEWIRMSTPKVTVDYDPNGQFKGQVEVYPNGSRVVYDPNMQIKHMDIVLPDGTKMSIGRDNLWRGSWWNW